MPPEIKRLHYYDQQFLREPDFTDEQTYHMDMRRRHNRLLHGWGVVFGLEVVRTSDHVITVQPGMAIDADGREIVLLESHEITLPSGASERNKKYYITIKYKLPEDLTDPPPPEDMIAPSDRTRVTERPDFPPPRQTVTDPTMTVILGRVHLADAGDAPIELPINEDERLYTPIVIDGKVGIGTTSPDYTLDVRKTGDFVARFGDNKGNDLTVDVAGGQGLANIVAGAKVSGNDYVFTGTRGASRVRLHDGGLTLMTSTVSSGTAGNKVNWKDALTVDNLGNVGIGTSDPKQNLSVEANRPRLVLTDKDGDAGVLEFHEGSKELRIQYWTGHGTTYEKTLMSLETDTGILRIGGIELVITESHEDTLTRWIVSHGRKALGFQRVDVDGDSCYSVITGPDWSKNFLINHPLDPQHKYLVHSALEGPEIAVFYRGEGELSSGKATVTLPDYFEALTRKENRTVLLTPKFDENAPVSMLAVSDIREGKFTVAMIDDKNPSQKFFWEVKAVRADVGVLRVEQAKT